MSEIMIFSGTTEGRELSEFLTEKKIKHQVFVATEYGKIIMKPSEFAFVSEGRLTEKDMEELFQKAKPAKVIDATHPYAIDVSENIKNALSAAGCLDAYIRVSRELPMTEALLREDYPDIKIVASTEEAIDFLKGTRGNILLTTGVKTLGQYAKVPELKERLFARILPSRESLELALEAGLMPRQILAMEGPFKVSMNEAMIDQYAAKVLVTKNSGIKGGFLEKLEACKNKRIQALVIDAAKKVEGISTEEAKKLLVPEGPKQRLSIVGIGVGNEKSMTVEALQRIKNAGLLIGAERMLKSVDELNSSALKIKEYEKEKVLSAVLGNGCIENVYLVSGDTGFFSGAAAFEDKNIEVEILPGISSISYFASLIKKPYSKALLLSSHGKEPDSGRLKEIIRSRENFFSITSGKDDFNFIGELVKAQGAKAKIYKGFNLGMDTEQVEEVEAEEFLPSEEKGLYIIGVFFSE